MRALVRTLQIVENGDFSKKNLGLFRWLGPGRTYGDSRLACPRPIVPYSWANAVDDFFRVKVMHSVIYRFTRLVNSILPAKFHVRSMRTEAAILIQSLRETPYALTVE